MSSKPPLVRDIAERLRQRIFAQPEGMLLGALPDLARELGVGIVTVQQAARILEHEGLLEVRRGPGGGYYGSRPDEAAMERAIASYMRTHPDSYPEALEITSLLFNELVPAAARCHDGPLRDALRSLSEQVDACQSADDTGAFEEAFQDLLFRMVNRPLFEVLTRVTLKLARTRPAPLLDRSADGLARWKAGRHRIIDAILAGDAELARFEADRSNRRAVSGALGKPPG